MLFRSPPDPPIQFADPLNPPAQFDDENHDTPPENQPSFYEDSSAFKGKLWDRRYKLRGHRDLAQTLYKYKAKYFRDLLKHYIDRKKTPVNFYIVVQTDMEKMTSDGDIEERSPYFRSSMRRMSHMSEFDELLDEANATILEKFGEWISEGSGWVLQRVDSITIKIAKYSPIKGRSYIKTPEKIKGKGALNNIQNEDQNCFPYCIVAALHPAKDHKSSVYSYKKKFEEMKANKEIIYSANANFND